MNVNERVTMVGDNLDEVVTSGPAHLECMFGTHKRGGWFLSMTRADGSEFCVWFHGEITMTEGRPAPERIMQEDASNE